ETQLRREYIDPFFKALGWDVDNTRGWAEAYKDVIHEDAIRIGSTMKAPDYCFRIGGTRKFFVEAKAPAVNLKDDPEPAYQLRRYAWSAKLPLSILTDFEEFAVYDCRVRPHHADKASKARTRYWRYTDYAEHWDEIASIFSYDAVLKGSFDKYATSEKRLHGTAEVDTAFLAEIETWRDSLARHIALRNPSLSNRQLNYAVQITIDRIIFLRICEDRGMERYGQLMALWNGPDVYPRLMALFRAADDRYNSGLFHFLPEKDRSEGPDELTPDLVIDDKPLKDILRSLYYPESPYEFSVLPAEILGQVYEQFLGKVITLTAGHHARVEDKPEVKKAGGVFYTPAYIVDYIVKQTVGKLLEDRTVVSYKTKPPKLDRPLRVLDPACGSGSFLLGAYQLLLDWYRTYYEQHDPETWAAAKVPPIYQAGTRGWRLTLAERKRILLDHIFGVDIDPQAVEVTKLSLLLRVLEGEKNLVLFHNERALPDLAGNIKCGNSLIGPDFYKGQQLGMFDEEERFRINAFDWHHEFAEAFKEGGFDAVIGNPPYGAYLYDEDKAYLTTRYRLQTHQSDSYLLFLEKALRDLLQGDGFYGMIIPNPWLTNLLQTSVRKHVVDNTRICSIVHFKFPVFPKVVVDTEIVVLQQKNPDNWTATVVVADTLNAFVSIPWEAGIRIVAHEQSRWRALNGGVINIFLSTPEIMLAEKCRRAGVRMDSLCAINVGIKPYQVGKGSPRQNRKVVEERPFDSDRRVDASYRAYLRGADIGRFRIAPVKPRYLRYGPWLAEPRPAANFDAPVKIVMRQTGDSIVAALDSRQFLCLNNMHVLVPHSEEPSPLYLLGVMNSRLLNWYYHTLNPEVGEALAEVKKTNVARLPIRALDLNKPQDALLYEKMLTFVASMLQFQKSLGSAKTPTEKAALERQIAATDGQIDQLVYELYGLTDEEIRIVEEATRG
ncbi:MAG: N-6 DNA methylase, partial [Planctomycetes bacterium]|nr:N-6 DNA methylase [Planctomycetota bacterium]